MADVDAMVAEVEVVRRPGRPSKVATLVPDRTLSERAAAVNWHHHAALATAAQAAMHAVLAGLELLAAQEEVEHGGWLAWVEANCECTARTSQKYMLLADRVKGRMVAGGEGGRLLLEAAPSDLTAEDRDRLLSSVAGFVDGATLTELYLDYGIIKGRTLTPVPKPGSRPGNGKVTEERREELANKDLLYLLKELRDFTLREHRHLLLRPEVLDAAQAGLQDVLNAMKNAGR